MNEDSRDNGVLKGALAVAGVGGAIYGSSAYLRSDHAKNYAENNDNIRSSIIKDYNAKYDDIMSKIKEQQESVNKDNVTSGTGNGKGNPITREKKQDYEQPTKYIEAKYEPVTKPEAPNTNTTPSASEFFHNEISRELDSNLEKVNNEVNNQERFKKMQEEAIEERNFEKKEEALLKEQEEIKRRNKLKKELHDEKIRKEYKLRKEEYLRIPYEEFRKDPKGSMKKKRQHKMNVQNNRKLEDVDKDRLIPIEDSPEMKDIFETGTNREKLYLPWEYGPREYQGPERPPIAPDMNNLNAIPSMSNENMIKNANADNFKAFDVGDMSMNFKDIDELVYKANKKSGKAITDIVTGVTKKL